MKFQVDEAEYLGLLKIKSVVEAALRSHDNCTTEAGYRRMFELIRAEVEAYYTAAGQPIPQSSVRPGPDLNENRENTR